MKYVVKLEMFVKELGQTGLSDCLQLWKDTTQRILQMVMKWDCFLCFANRMLCLDSERCTDGKHLKESFNSFPVWFYDWGGWEACG
jgi:hypothetical protein